MSQKAATTGERTRRVTYVSTDGLRPEGAESTCLRPLGLCELGGACDACWYRPDHPRFKEHAREE
jgi:hypothetical protein